MDSASALMLAPQACLVSFLVLFLHEFVPRGTGDPHALLEVGHVVPPSESLPGVEPCTGRQTDGPT